MRVVALEEHFSVPALVKGIDPGVIARRGYFGKRNIAPGRANPLELMPEIGERRIGSMTEAGIDVQVLSNGGVGPELVPGPDGVGLARKFNDYLADAIARHPRRFAGFTTLPMASPEACATELFRSVRDLGMVGAMVHGSTEGRFLDHPAYDDLLAAAVELDVPLYIHPNVPTLDIRQAYFSGLPEGADRVLATAAWGWHSETALHVLRMLYTGTLDRHPRLKLVVGHMGEMLPMMLGRLDGVSAADIGHLSRKPSQTLTDQVWITTSGFFTQPPFIVALQTFGIDRIMFSNDYPFASHAQGRQFLDQVALSPADLAKLCHGNADALLKLKP